MKSILSTKKLKPNQRDLLLSQGFSMVDYNAIVIEFLDFEMPNKIENAIFTSQNGVLSFLRNYNAHPNTIENCLCVGQKTKILLEENGLKVKEIGNNAKQLAQIIAKNYINEQFHYFCGEQRREELLTILKASKINVSEVKTYKTILKPRKFDKNWDGILFYSPSGVESYAVANLKGVKAIPQQVENDSPLTICIGETTAKAAKQYFKNIVVANSTTIESVIAKAVKELKKSL